MGGHAITINRNEYMLISLCFFQSSPVNPFISTFFVIKGYLNRRISKLSVQDKLDFMPNNPFLEADLDQMLQYWASDEGLHRYWTGIHTVTNKQIRDSPYKQREIMQGLVHVA